VLGTLQSYISLGGIGCAIGPEVAFRDFTFALAPASTVALAATDILVSPSQMGPLFILTFSRIGPPGLSPAPFSIPTGHFLDFTIRYNVDPHPIIDSFEDTMLAFSPTSPGRADVTTQVCIGSAYFPACVPTATLHVFHDGVAPVLIQSTAFAPTHLIGVNNQVSLDTRLGGTSDFNALRNTIGTTLPVGSAVPEPAGFALCACALALLAWRKK
jgi:hypothetical protein